MPNLRDREADRRTDPRSAGFDLPSARTKERIATYAADAADELGEAALRDLISERAPWFTGSIDQLVWHSVVRFERRLAESFGKDRMWLAGDAAHLTGPVGVQSMNVGLSEAYELAGLIERVLRGGEPVSGLSVYDQRGRATWRGLHGLEGAVKPAEGADSWVAPYAKALLSCLPAFGAELAAQAAQLGLDIAPANRAAAG